MKNTAHFQFWPQGLPKSLTTPETTLFDNLDMSAKKYPNKTAMHFYGSSMTYRELLNESINLGGYLEKELGIQKGDNVMLFMQNSPQFIISMFGILRARAVIIPINPMSTTEDLKFYVEDGDIDYAIVGQELYDKVAPLKEENLLQEVIVASYNDYANISEALEEVPAEVAAPAHQFDHTISWNTIMNNEYTPSPYTGTSEDIAIIPYTSGTTGKPKGCVHTNRSVQANTVGAYHWAHYTSDAVSLTTLPLFHVTGVVHSAFTPIFGGGTLVILTRWDRNYAAEAIQEYSCTHWVNISTMLIDFLYKEGLAEYDLSSIQFIGGGGAALPEAVGNQLKEMTGLMYVEGYGLSETISQTHFNPPHRPKLQCLGIPAFGVDARIIDTETNKELGVNEEGELIVSGPQLFEGYYNRPEDNEESHIELDGKRYFRTGDIVKMDEEGYFFIVDRLKRMINAAGFKVWPTEVESVLFKHPAVQQACVISAPDEVRGETVKAFIIPNEEYKNEVTAEEIIEWSREQLANYKAPRLIEFRDELPMTSTGKVLWRELQEQEMAKQ